MRIIYLTLLSIIAFTFCVDFQIIFKERVDFATLRHPISNQKLEELDFQTRGKVVFHALKTTADLTQRHVRELLTSLGYKFTPFWAANIIILHNGDERIVQLLQNRDEVERIEVLSDFVYRWEQNFQNATRTQGPEWNVQMVKAPEAWKKGFKGQNVVVGILDTGVNFKHKDLVSKYRGFNNDGSFEHNYNWFDATPGKRCKDVPCDTHGHGSHVTGTIVGGNDVNQIGVAIDAKYIFCSPGSMPTTKEFAKCLEWFVAPTNLDDKDPNPDKRPAVINNSWGSPTRQTIFDEIIKALHASGVLALFAAGNEGSRCGTLRYPGANEEVLTIGATGDRVKTIATFSSRGPAQGQKYPKPNVVAPGQNIKSCSRMGDEYTTMSGTSMATPCAVGSVAVILSAKPELIGNIDGIKKLLEKSADPQRTTECGSPEAHPNYVYGYGLIDIEKAISL